MPRDDDSERESEPDTAPAPWWTAPLESPWANTARPIQRPSASAAPVEPLAVASVAPAATSLAGLRSYAGHVGDAAPVSAIHHANRRTTPEPGPTRPQRRPVIWSSVVVVAAIVLVSLFFAGQRLVGGTSVAESSPAATEVATESTTESVTESTSSAEVTGLAAAGSHPWTALYGGECLDPYVSPWAEEFTVVECGTPHSAQLVFRGQFESDPVATFPGEAALAAQIPVLCAATDVIQLTVAAALGDVQVQGSYPVTQAQWAAGQREYYCFVSRSGGDLFTASLAV